MITLVVAALATLTLVAALLVVVMGIHCKSRWSRPTSAPPTAFTTITRRILGFHVLTSDTGDRSATRERAKARR